MEKRKSIVIYQENVAPIFLEDEDDRNLEEYSKALSSFMTLTNITILHTSNASLIIRPSKITSISVHEDSQTLNLPDEIKEPVEEVKEEKEEQVDIIKDVD